MPSSSTKGHCLNHVELNRILAKVSCFIFVARSDATYLPETLPQLCQMIAKANCKVEIVLDTTPPKGVLGESLAQSQLSDITAILETIQKDHSFEIEHYSSDDLKEAKHLSKLHFGKSYRETHCFRGYPLLGSIRQFHKDDSDYVLHFDSDMLFHETEGFSWIESGIDLMEEHDDIVCVLPRGGPPTSNDSLFQGTTDYRIDQERGIYLFKNFTSRHYLIHRKRFLELLPMKPIWLSWREPIKSMLLGNGKMLCWETIVENAISKSKYWRADLMTTNAWSLHPGDRSAKFHNLLPKIMENLASGRFPIEQCGHFDLCIEAWDKFIND